MDLGRGALLTDPYVQVVGALEGEEEVQLLKNLSVRKKRELILHLFIFGLLHNAASSSH